MNFLVLFLTILGFFLGAAYEVAAICFTVSLYRRPSAARGFDGTPSPGGEASAAASAPAW